mgnify:FL=1
MPDDEFQQLRLEHGAIMQIYQEAQIRCTEQIQSLAHETEKLKRQLIRLRAQLIARDTALFWEREQRHAMAIELAASLLTQSSPSKTQLSSASLPATPEQQLLESSLHAADLVICQTGCISDGDYWRVEDHCKRNGKQCVLVDEPNALRVVRLHMSSEDGKVVAAQASLESTRQECESD